MFTVTKKNQMQPEKTPMPESLLINVMTYNLQLIKKEAPAQVFYC